MTDDEQDETFAMPPTLAAYWTTGPGAIRIRWGTPGDLTRCARQLREHVKPGQEWGTCQNLHKRLFGVPNPRD